MKNLITIVIIIILSVLLFIYFFKSSSKQIINRDRNESITIVEGTKDTAIDLESVSIRKKLTPRNDTNSKKTYCMKIDSNNISFNLCITDTPDSDTLDTEFFLNVKHKTITSSDTIIIKNSEFIHSETSLNNKSGTFTPFSQSLGGSFVLFIIGGLTGIIAALLLLSTN